MSVLSDGPKDRTGILTSLGKKYSDQLYGRLSEYLWELEEVAFIRRDYSWNIKDGEDSKLSKYRLQDNYLRFYLKYIKKNLGKINRGLFSFRSLALLPEWNSIIGFQFENLVRV